MEERIAKQHGEATITLMVKWMNNAGIKKEDIVALLFNKQYILVYYE